MANKNSTNNKMQDKNASNNGRVKNSTKDNYNNSSKDNYNNSSKDNYKDSSKNCRWDVEPLPESSRPRKDGPGGD